MNNQQRIGLVAKLQACVNQNDAFAVCRNFQLSEEQTNEVISTLFYKGNAMQANQNTQTRRTFDSQILGRSFDYEAQRLIRNYLKKKEAALKARGDAQAALIGEAKEARAALVAFTPWMPAETIISDAVTEFCGLGREWNASGKMVAQFAEANGVDQQLAADLVGRQMTVAQDYAQATRGIKFGRYLSWIEDAMNEADDDGSLPQNIEELVTGAYQRAAQWNQPADGLMIRDFAESIGISDILPSWADTLKANMPSAEQAMEARKRIANRAAAAASAEQEAEQELTQHYGTF